MHIQASTSQTQSTFSCTLVIFCQLSQMSVISTLLGSTWSIAHTYVTCLLEAASYIHSIPLQRRPGSFLGFWQSLRYQEPTYKTSPK